MLAVLAAPAGAQTTWYVDVNASPPGDGTPAHPYASIQYAISRSRTLDGDTVLVLPGTYRENVDFLGKAIQVIGRDGAATTIVDAGDSGSVVSFVSGEGPSSVLEGLTISHGAGTGCCSLEKGGGIYCVGASPTLAHLVVEGNRAVLGGGIYFENGSSSVEDCTIRDNELHDLYGAGPASGIGIYADCPSSPTVTNCRILHNRTANYGGGIFGAGTYVNCRIEGNAATFGGGSNAGMCDLRLEDCELVENLAASVDADDGVGGGAFGGTLVDCRIAANIGAYQGGGASDATLVGCTVEGNVVYEIDIIHLVAGGGTARCDLQDCEVRDNRSGTSDPHAVYPGNGGGIAFGTAVRSKIHHNRCEVYGLCSTCPFQSGIGGAGGFDATLEDCDVYENVVEATLYQGNYPAGGGLFACQATRCRIWQNSCPYGGGAANSELESCTVHANVSIAGGGGLAAILGSASAHDSIFWLDSAPEMSEPSRGSITVEYSDVRGGSRGVGNFDADPLLWAPFTGDFHLKPGSPCIDAGDPASPPDPDGSRADVGAFPFAPRYCGEPGTYCLAKTNSLGCEPAIGFSGAPSVSGPDDFHVTASLFGNRKTGFLFFGPEASMPPFAAGASCVRGAIVRAPPQDSGGSPPPVQDCSGTFDVAFTHAYMSAHGLGAASTVHAQWFARDPAQADGTGASLSNALEFTICP
jgi:hypothetical protein